MIGTLIIVALSLVGGFGFAAMQGQSFFIIFATILPLGGVIGGLIGWLLYRRSVHKAQKGDD